MVQADLAQVGERFGYFRPKNAKYSPTFQARCLRTFFGQWALEVLLLSTLSTVTPQFGTRNGHSWKNGFRYIFSYASLSTSQLSSFLCLLLEIWCFLWTTIVHKHLSHWEELDQQPLIWNSHVVTQTVSNWACGSTLIGLCGVLDLHYLLLLGASPVF